MPKWTAGSNEGFQLRGAVGLALFQLLGYSEDPHSLSRADSSRWTHREQAGGLGLEMGELDSKSVNLWKDFSNWFFEGWPSRGVFGLHPVVSGAYFWVPFKGYTWRCSGNSMKFQGTNPGGWYARQLLFQLYCPWLSDKLV